MNDLRNVLGRAHDTAESAYAGEVALARANLRVQIAIAEMLNERLPEKPMQVIPTATPFDGVVDTSHYKGVFESTFKCKHTPSDKLVLERAYGNKSLRFLIEDDGKKGEVLLNDADAVRLAKTILAAIPEVKD